MTLGHLSSQGMLAMTLAALASLKPQAIMPRRCECASRLHETVRVDVVSENDVIDDARAEFSEPRPYLDCATECVSMCRSRVGKRMDMDRNAGWLAKERRMKLGAHLGKSWILFLMSIADTTNLRLDQMTAVGTAAMFIPAYMDYSRAIYVKQGC